MSDNPFKKRAKAKRRGKTPSGSQDAAPQEQGGAAEGVPMAGSNPAGQEDAPSFESNVESNLDSDLDLNNDGPWPFALGPMPDDSAQDASAPDASTSDQSAIPLTPEVRKQLVLVKHGHRYVFRYERGEETKVLSGLVEMARDPQSELDWFDAAVLSHQLGERMSEQLDRLRRA